MADEWENRYGSKTEDPERIKRCLCVRVFSPYSGTCEDIMENVCSDIRSNESYNIKVCSNAPESNSIDSIPERDVYNLESSRECMTHADVGVFVFLKAKEERFEESSYPMPQDLNASVVLELSEWMRKHSNTKKVFVIYEEGVKKSLGSLVRGVVKKNDIEHREISTETQEDTVESLKSAITGQCQVWAKRLEAILRDRFRSM